MREVEGEEARFVATGSVVEEVVVLMGVNLLGKGMLGKVGREEIGRGVGGVSAAAGAGRPDQGSGGGRQG